MAALWSEVWWIGQVNAEMVHEEYAINFMHPVDGSKVDECKIDWPDYKDVTPIPVADILCVVSQPVPTLFKQKWCKTLPRKEVDSIKTAFFNATH